MHWHHFACSFMARNHLKYMYNLLRCLDINLTSWKLLLLKDSLRFDKVKGNSHPRGTVSVYMCTNTSHRVTFIRVRGDRRAQYYWKGCERDRQRGGWRATVVVRLMWGAAAVSVFLRARSFLFYFTHFSHSCQTCCRKKCLHSFKSAHIKVLLW